MEHQKALARIEELITAPLTALGYNLVRIKLTSGSPATLQIMIERLDKRNLVIEDCVKSSHCISTLFEVEDPLNFEYNLEVSSPGIDRPLVKRIDFEIYATEVVKIELAQLRDGQKKFVGKLLGINARDEVEIIEIAATPTKNGKANAKKLKKSDGANQSQEESEKIIALPFSLIIKAKLVITDQLLAKHQAAAQKHQIDELTTDHSTE